MRPRMLMAILLLLLIPALAACGATGTPAAGETPMGGEEPTSAATEAPAEAPMGGGEAEVTMINTTFQPEEITVQAGTTVTWTNEDPLPHTVTSGPRDNPSDLFDSGSMGQGDTFSFTFDEPGTYEYVCTIHPGMEGTVTVE